MRSNLVVRWALCLLILGLGLGACGQENDFGSINVFNIQLPDLDGNQTRLDQFKGQVILLNFWASWCAPCRQEIPDFIALQDQYGPKGLVIVGVSLDEEGPAYLGAFARELGINYPILRAGDQITRVRDQVGGFRGIPTTLLVDRTGRVVVKYTGLAPGRTWEAQIKKVL
jgi:thiol-disulfide isomerase/thioredoxin